MMLRSILCLAVFNIGISSSDSCVESDGLSAMQNRLHNRLQERSGQEVSQQGVQGNVEQAIASKGKPVERTAGGKSRKSIAKLKMSVTNLEERLPAAKEAFSSASDDLKLHMRGDANMAKTADLAEAFTQAEGKLLKIEAQLATQYDDLVLKLGATLWNQGSSRKRDEVMADMQIYYSGSDVLHDEINTRMKELAEEFHGVKERVLVTAVSDKVVLDAATKDLWTKIAVANETFQNVSTAAQTEAAKAAVEAANAAEDALVIALIPAVKASEQFKRIGEIVQNILVQTNKKLWSLKSSFQRHVIQAEEARSSEEFLLARANDYEGWKDRAQADFNWQFTETQGFMSHLEDELNQTKDSLKSFFWLVGQHRLWQAGSTNKDIRSKYDVSNMQTIRMEVYKVASVHAAVKRTRTSAAEKMAKDKNTALGRQLERAKASSSEKVMDTVVELESQVADAQAELKTASWKEDEGWSKARELPKEFCTWANLAVAPTSGMQCQRVE